MDNNGPNKLLRKKQLNVRLLELQLNLERMDLRKAELEEEKRKIDANLEATNLAIEEIKKEIGE